MSRLRSHFLPAFTLVVAVALAVLALRDEPRASWARVNAPAEAAVGMPYAASVILSEPHDGAFLSFDLHGHGPGDTPLRCIASAPRQEISSATSEYRFAVTVPQVAGLEKVHVVIYLSPDGSWTRHTRTASSHPFSIASGGAGQPATGNLAVYEPDGESAIEVPHPPVQRAAIAAVWIVCALVTLTCQPRSTGSRKRSALALAFAGLAFLEATDMLASAADLARGFARSHGWYEQRRGFQQVATAVVVLGLGAIVAAGFRRSRAVLPGLVVAGMAVFMAAELAGMLSLHEVDRVLAWPVGPFAVDAILRAGGATCALAGMIRHAYSNR